MYQALYIIPIIPSFNIEETARFFRDLLGFSTFLDYGNYVILYKDSSTVHICEAIDTTGEMSFYFEIDNVDGLWAEIRGRLYGITTAKAPFDQHYGMREIHLLVPNTKALMIIGQRLAG